MSSIGPDINLWGLVGRALNRKGEVIQPPNVMRQWRNLLLPGIREYVGRLGPLHPIRDIDLVYDVAADVLRLECERHDGGPHEAGIITRADIAAGQREALETFRAVLHRVCPLHLDIFADEVVVAYDDPRCNPVTTQF